MNNNRNSERRTFSYYMPAYDNRTEKILGHVADISAQGLRLDSQEQLPTNHKFEVRLELTGDMSVSPFMIFLAITRWCRPDEITPNVYNVGFEILEMHPEDIETYQRLIAQYSTTSKPW